MLIGEHVFLRIVEEEDLPLIVDWRNAPSIWANFFNKFPLSKGKQKDWFERMLKDESRMLFMICTIKEKKTIGTIGLDHIDFGNQTAEYGNILISEQEFTGKGYALEATNILLSYCFLRLNMNRVYLKVLADNSSAIKLYEGTGFIQEGVLREAHFDEGIFKDVIVMSILRKEYINR